MSESSDSSVNEAEKPVGRLAKTKALIVGVAGLFAAILGFTEKGKELVSEIVDILPASIASMIPFSAIARENEKVDYILSNRYINSSIIEEAFGKQTAERNAVVDSKEKVLSAYFGNPGNLYLEKSRGSIDSLMFMPSRSFGSIEREINRYSLMPPYDLAHVKEAFRGSKYIIIDRSSQNKPTIIDVLSVSIFSSYKALIGFAYPSLKDCGPMSWGIGGGNDLKDLPCSNTGTSGKIVMIILVRDPPDVEDNIEHLVPFYNDIMNRALMTSPVLQRQFQ